MTHTFAGDTQKLKGRSGSVSVDSPGMHKVWLEPSDHLWWVCSLILNVISSLLPFCLGFSFVLGSQYLLLMGSNILLLMVVQQKLVILEFSQEKMSACPSTPSSCVV